MTADANATTAPARHAAGSHGVTQLRVAVSEWTKLRSINSTRWALLAACTLPILVAVVFASAATSRWPDMDAAQRASFDPLRANLIGITLGQLIIGALGVLAITAEYSTGMIRASLTAVPQRLPLLWGKAAVYGLVTVTLMIPTIVVAFVVAQAILAGEGIGVGLSDPGVARALIGGGLFLAVTVVFALGLGAIVRSTAGGIFAFVGIMLLLPQIVGMLPASWNDTIAPYLPPNAGRAVTSITDDPDQLAPWVGFGLYGGYTAATLAGAAVLLMRRDV